MTQDRSASSPHRFPRRRRPVGRCLAATPVHVDAIAALPGERLFRPGERTTYIARLRRMLMPRRASRYLQRRHPGYSWRACTACQGTQCRSAAQASGIPNSVAGYCLITGRACSISPVPAPSYPVSSSRHHPSINLSALPAGHVPSFPGREYFGPGKANSWILLLRLRLIIGGWAEESQRLMLQWDPGLKAASTWDDAVRQAYTRFQLAQGRRGTAADGYPTKEAWPLLWSASARQ